MLDAATAAEVGIRGVRLLVQASREHFAELIPGDIRRASRKSFGSLKWAVPSLQLVGV